MSTIKGTTVAAVKTEANAAFEQVQAELEAKRRELAAVQEELAKKTAQDEEHTREIAQLQGFINEMKAQLAEPAEGGVVVGVVTPAAPDEELIELVALPGKDVKVPDLVFDGKRALKKVDEDGYVHFKVARRHAETLLASEGGLKFVFVGPVQSLTVARREGLHTRQVTIPRHVRVPYPTGGSRWDPVVEVEGPGK